MPTNFEVIGLIPAAAWIKGNRSIYISCFVSDKNVDRWLKFSPPPFFYLQAGQGAEDSTPWLPWHHLWGLCYGGHCKDASCNVRRTFCQYGYTSMASAQLTRRYFMVFQWSAKCKCLWHFLCCGMLSLALKATGINSTRTASRHSPSAYGQCISFPSFILLLSSNRHCALIDTQTRTQSLPTQLSL